MGNLASHSNFTISVMPPYHDHFNFHHDYIQTPEEQTISFPSFISKPDDHSMKYCTRSNFNARQFEMSYEEQDNASVVVFSKVAEHPELIWKNMAPNECVPLVEGSIIKLGNAEFEIKKLCGSFADLGDWDEHMKTTSDLDARDRSVNYSRNLANSKQSNGGIAFQSRNAFAPGLSLASSLGMDQEGDFCRYCYGRDSTSSNPLLNLCKCSGSVKFSHYNCLKNWISSRSKTKASDCFEYFEYDLSCEVCKQTLSRSAMHKGKRYVLYSESVVHPPFIVMSYRNDS
jgi:hypothetical protein